MMAAMRMTPLEGSVQFANPAPVSLILHVFLNLLLLGLRSMEVFFQPY